MEKKRELVIDLPLFLPYVNEIRNCLLQEIDRKLSSAQRVIFTESGLDAAGLQLIRRRLIEHRREALAEQIKEAREEYKRGEVRRGTVDDLLREIAE